MFKTRYYLCLLGALILIVSACASTKVTSYRDTAYAGKKFGKIMVWAPGLSLEGRMKLEEAIATQITEKGGSTTPSIGVIQPTRKYSLDEMFKTARDQGYEGILGIELTAAYTESTQLPGHASTIWGRGYSTTIYTPGEYIHKPRVKFNFRLVEISTNQTAWISSTFTRGNAFANLDTLCNSLAAITAEKLNQDGLLSSGAPLPATPAIEHKQKEKAASFSGGGKPIGIEAEATLKKKPDEQEVKPSRPSPVTQKTLINPEALIIVTLNKYLFLSAVVAASAVTVKRG